MHRKIGIAIIKNNFTHCKTLSQVLYILAYTITYVKVFSVSSTCIKSKQNNKNYLDISKSDDRIFFIVEILIKVLNWIWSTIEALNPKTNIANWYGLISLIYKDLLYIVTDIHLLGFQ